MTIWQLRVLPFSVALIIIASCLSSIAAPWSEKDGMRLTVPKRMARLLKKLTKQQGKFWKNSVGDLSYPQTQSEHLCHRY